LSGNAVGCGPIHQDSWVESGVLTKGIPRYAFRMSIPL
jgi:hypothetical protein